jgi:fructokinase
LTQRWKLKNATDLPSDHIGWDLEAKYLAYGMANCILAVSPLKIILGGGVMKHKELYSKVRKMTLHFLNNFIQNDLLLNDIDNFIVPPSLGDNAGLCGCFALAKQIHEKS